MYSNTDKEGIFRRSFLKFTGIGLGSALAGLPVDVFGSQKMKSIMKRIKIVETGSDFEREPLHPYRFKGGAITDSWQSVAMLESSSGIRKVGLGTQGVLWSDASVARAHSEAGGNALMYAVSEYALQLVKGISFESPIELLDRIYPEVYDFAKRVTQNPDLRKTFALNALVCVDNAAWLLYAAENKIDDFDSVIPEEYKQGLSARHTGVASIPSFPTGTDIRKIKEAADSGFFIMKLKTGAPGTQNEMLEKDKEFLTAVHKTLSEYETPHTDDGKIPYYFDANGRYEKKETLQRFLDHAKKIGAFDRLAVIEEPFPEHNHEYVGDMGVRVASDESAHTVEDAAHRIELGYTAFAVKAIAKTMSMTMKICQLAYEKDIPCFCADLTVNPILVEWNKNVAARLPAFPGIDVGLQEANGHQYYKNWDRLMSYHPMSDGEWVEPEKGVFKTGRSFYGNSGGIFEESEHYTKMFEF
ncbi:enolase C-terminal domain-like protein [Membranihabitans maritimus]|uniref:enolase C-terminal domain-like protein n=1 Tax=Membranihabitans maritimus TaxID=2904244 RepID=UPI001F1F847E|nr:enolase C-terminal domain-like protein [Membranihabitans maritimus]